MGGRFTRNRKGQSIVEFALVVPMLIMLVFGIAEFGRAWMMKNILTGAAREAVRVNTAMVTIKYDFPRNRSERYSGPWQLDHAYPFLVDEKRIATLNHFLGDPAA